MAPESVKTLVKAGPMYWDTPVISVTFPSSRIAVLLFFAKSGPRILDTAFASGVS
jgi:hypothetical protein